MSDNKILVGDMSRKQCLEILKRLLEAMETFDGISPSPERINALKMAISSLETDEAYQLEYESTTKNDSGVDCISRQATINAVKRIHPVDTDYDCTLYDKVDVMYVLDEMPSVTPQESIIDKIRADLYKLYNDRPSDYNHSQRTELFCEVIKILDKYKAETEAE